MPSKPRKLRLPRWFHSKARGEFAETIFVAKAQALGLAVSKPYGDNQPFDFHVQSRLGTFRVQVRSAWRLGKNRHIAVPADKSLNKCSGFDVVVVYVAPMDLWYVIPASVVTRWLSLYPRSPNSKGKYERFREGWRTLTGDPQDDSRLLGLTIHAQRDDGDSGSLP